MSTDDESEPFRDFRLRSRDGFVGAVPIYPCYSGRCTTDREDALPGAQHDHAIGFVWSVE
jgi:hypothetical protein